MPAKRPPAPGPGKAVRTVLIAERDRSAADYTSHFLREEGLRVVVALDVESAQQLIVANHFDLIIVESMLSGGVGTALVKAVKTLADVPVVMVSHPGVATPDEAVRSGADAFLYKPIEVGTLVDEVTRLLQTTNGVARSEPPARPE